MKFSLRTFLVVVCVVGAVAGVMGKLLLEDPESFVTVWMLGMTVGPFVLAILTIAVVGVRVKKRGLVVWSIVLLLLPFTSFAMRALFLSSGNPVQLLTTWRLIEHRLPKQIDDFRIWQELNRRLGNNSLSREDVEEAIVTLTDHMKATRPAGWNQPLSWQNDFIKSVVQGKLISKEVWLNLCDAFFGTQPTVKPIAPVPAGQRGVQIRIEYGSPWASSSGIGVELMWDVKRVLLDGVPLKITNPNRFAQLWDAYCDGPLKPGDHELKIDMECAYVDNKLVSFGNAGSLKISQWPKGIKRWTTTVTAPVTVSGAGK
jgi:hypothetical protein